MLASIGATDCRYPLLDAAIREKRWADATSAINGRFLSPLLEYHPTTGFSLDGVKIPSEIFDECVKSPVMAASLPLVCRYIKNLDRRDCLSIDALACLKSFRILSADSMILVGSGVIDARVSQYQQEFQLRYYTCGDILMGTDSLIDDVIERNGLSCIRKPFMARVFPVGQTMVNEYLLKAMLILSVAGSEPLTRKAFSVFEKMEHFRVVDICDVLLRFTGGIRIAKADQGAAAISSKNTMLLRDAEFMNMFFDRIVLTKRGEMANVSSAAGSLSIADEEHYNRAKKAMGTKRMKEAPLSTMLFALSIKENVAYPISWAGRHLQYEIRTPKDSFEMALWGMNLKNCIRYDYDSKSRGFLIGVFEKGSIVAAARWNPESLSVDEYRGPVNTNPPADFPIEHLRGMLARNSKSFTKDIFKGEENGADRPPV